MLLNRKLNNRLISSVPCYVTEIYSLADLEGVFFMLTPLHKIQRFLNFMWFLMKNWAKYGVYALFWLSRPLQ